MKAVVFDLDGTLINSAISFKEMKSRIIQYLQGVGVTPGLLSEGMLNFEITSKAKDHLRQKGFTDKYIEKTFAKASEIMNEVELESLNDATLVEGALETLEALRSEGLKLGLMTRSCHEYAEKILARFWLRKYFDAVVARDDVRNPKPDPEHALHLLRLLGVPTEDALFVGDHWSDAECARKAGLRFVLVTRRGEEAETFESDMVQKVSDIRETVGIAKVC